MLAIGLVAGIILVNACSSTATAPTAAATSSAITVDDAAATVYVALGDSARVVTATDAWDLSFFTTTIALNSGVSAYCLCGNEAATGDAVMAMTVAGQSSAFDRVSSSDVPVATSFAGDVFANHKWYRYNITGTDNQIWPVFNVYLVKRGTAIYKIQVVNYYNSAGEPRHVTVRYQRIQS